jgi:antirestriction protein ArdC
MRYNDLIAEVNRNMIRLVEEAIAAGPEWKMPWHQRPELMLPINESTGKPYQGGNTVLTLNSMIEAGYRTNRWATLKQWNGMGFMVAKGQRATTRLAFFKDAATRTDGDTGEVKTYRLARVFAVFNGDQVVAAEPGGGAPWEPPADPRDVHDPARRREDLDQWIEETGVKVVNEFTSASYVPSVDMVRIPRLEQFPDPASYYATMFHELVHATSHSTRLGRSMAGFFPEDPYAGEELVAELGAAMLCAIHGVPNNPRADHTQYLAGWAKGFQSVPNALVVAGKEAHKAVGFLLELAGDPSEAKEEEPTG